MSDDKKPLNAEEVKAKPHRTFIQLNKLEPDYSHWAKATSWTCTEMIFLVNGVDPEKALAGKGHTYGNALKYHFEPFITIQKQLKLTDRAKNDEVLPSRNSPLSSISWCQSKQIQVPLELLRLCVDATKHKLTHDEVLEELKKNAEELDPKLNVKALKDKEPGEDAMKNRNRLVAILKDMLLDPDVGKHGVFKNQEAIANYIHTNYDEKYPDKKLTAKGIQDIFALGNKALKDTE